MKATTLLLNFHNQQAIYSIDSSCGRIATAGADSTAKLWRLAGSKLVYLCSLSRHDSAVNCVRWLPNRPILATAGDDGSVIIWQQVECSVQFGTEDGDEGSWRPLAVLTGSHRAAVFDLCWSPCGRYIAAASDMDNAVRIWSVEDRQLVQTLTDHRHFVQGVSWSHSHVATLSSDRQVFLYTWDQKKAALEVRSSRRKQARLFYDDTLVTFFRRCSFSPDGQQLVCPSGVYEEKNVAWIFETGVMKRGPVAAIPCGSKPSVGVRFMQRALARRFDVDGVRFVYAVATQEAVYVYDTEQSGPIAMVKHLHYHNLTDMTWVVSDEGAVDLICSSTDGFCSVVSFEPLELGVFVEQDSFDGANQHLSVTAVKEQVVNILQVKKLK